MSQITDTPLVISHWKEALDKAILCQLFILALGILFIQIRNTDQVKGLKIDNNIIKLSVYADNTCFIVLDVPSIQQVYIICNIFE